jgi:hypothetical protein
MPKMPSNFQQALPTSSPTMAPISTSGGSSAAETGAALAQATGQIMDAYVTRKKQQVLGSLALEAQTAVSETSKYQTAKDSIVSKLSVADKDTFGQLSGQLERLRKGEVQGVLSPQAANIRLQSLAKGYINRYPRMAGEIRQMLKLVSGDISPDTKQGDIADPVLKAQYAIVEEAQARGTSPQEVVALRRQKDATEMSKSKLEQAQSEGNYKLPEIMFELVDNKSSEMFSELISGMVSRVKTGQFVKENELTGLHSAMAQGIVDLNKELTNYEIENNVRVDHKQFEDRLKSAYEPLISIAGEADTMEKQKRFASAQDTILKATDYKYLHDTLGAFAQVAINSPESMFKFMEQMSKTVEQIQKGQLPSLEEAAKYDPKTKMLLDQLKANGKSWDLLMKRSSEILSHGAANTSTGVEAIDRLSQKIILDTAASPGTPLEVSSKMLANDIYSGDSIDGIVLHKRVHNILANSREAQNAVDQMSLQEMTSHVANAPMSQLRNVHIDFGSQTPFQNMLPPVPRQTATKDPRMPSMIRDANVNQPNNFADKMNNYYKLMLIYKDPESAQKDIVDQFQQLIGRRVEDELTAAQEILGRNGPHQGDKQAGDKKKEQDSQTTTMVGGAGARYQLEDKTGALIDTKSNRILPDSYTFSPEEQAQLEKDLAKYQNPNDFKPAE